MGHVTKECREGGASKVELNSTTILPRQAEELETLNKEKRPTHDAEVRKEVEGGDGRHGLAGEGELLSRIV